MIGYNNMPTLTRLRPTNPKRHANNPKPYSRPYLYDLVNCLARRRFIGQRQGEKYRKSNQQAS